MSQSTSGPTTTRRTGRQLVVSLREPARAVWILPVVVILGVLILTALGISGTSTPELTSGKATDSSVIVGTPRAIRSDEWLVRTPMVIGQVERGFPRYAEVGVGVHDMSVISDLPTLGWPQLFRPHQIGFFVLPAANGFAFEWWAPAAFLMLGVYALMLVVFRDWRWAALSALVMFGSPFFHWWYHPTTFGMLGWAAAAVAALLWSFESDSEGWGRWWRVVFAGYAAACFALFLYPPSQIPVIFVLLAVVVGVTIPKLLEGSWRMRRIVINSAVAVGAVLLVVAAFVITRRPALSAIAGTVYPGARREVGGTGSIETLFQGWYGWEYVRSDIGMRGSVFANESEASSFLFLGLMLVLGLPFVWRSVFDLGRRTRLLAIAVLVAIAALLVHLLIGFPAIVNRITLLDRVTVNRVLLGLGFASVFFMVLLGTALADATIDRWRRVAAGALVTVIGASYVWSLGTLFREGGAPVTPKAAAFTVLLFVIPAALWFWKPLVSMSALAVIGLAVSLPANPLVRGLDPLTSSPFATMVRDVHRDDGNDDGVWIADTWDSSSVITAAGVNNLSGVNLYPDADAWKILDSSSRYEDIWNRYAITEWMFDVSASAPVITLVHDDVVSIRLNPCGNELDQLGVNHIVTAGRALTEGPTPACLTKVESINSPSGTPVTVFDRALSRQF